MNKDTKIIIGVIVGGLLIVGGIWFATRKEEMVKIPLEDKTEITTDVFKNEYMDGCMDNDISYYTYCNCSYNSLVNQMGEKKLIEVAVNYLNTEEFPAEVLTKVIADCIQYYK